MDATQAQGFVKQCYEEKSFSVNGREYKYLPTTHEKRLRIFSYMMGIHKKMSSGDLSFMGSPEWKDIVRLMENLIMFDEQILSRIKDHWEDEEKSKDYAKLMLTSLQVIAYPLL